MNQASWTGDHVSAVCEAAAPRSAPIAGTDVVPVAPDLGIWDAWPLQRADGSPHLLPGARELWMALAAPRAADPDERHSCARIHLVLRDAAGWRHLGPAMPDGFSPGSREWSGSAVVDSAGQHVTLYFTAAGRRGERSITFEQRMFSAEAMLDLTGEDPRLGGWRALREIVEFDPRHYMTTVGGPGVVGQIKAFRDPAFFRDPACGQDYLFFAGSKAGSSSAFNGVIGLACADPSAPSGWTPLPPLISADTLNNELERPHAIFHDSRYYLFWSTQRHVFDPAGPTGPTGLYGMVSDTLLTGWRPINGTGLVLANPSQAPAQAYSWLVLPDLSVTSFVDDWHGSDMRTFGGTFAPFLHLRIDGDRVSIER